MASERTGGSPRDPGRPQKQIDPLDGPVAVLAQALRDLRDACGRPPYRTLQRQCAGIAHQRLAEAARGEVLPSWAVVEAYVRGCRAYHLHKHKGEPPPDGTGDLARWRELYRNAGGEIPGDQPRGSAGERAKPQAKPPSDDPAAPVPARTPAGRPPLRRRVTTGVRREARGTVTADATAGAWPRLALGILALAAVLASPSSSASRPVTVPRTTAWCAYVTALPAPVLAAPSESATQVNAKDLGDGIEILPLPRRPGWSPVYTPGSRPDHNWMRTSALSPAVAGARPCPDKAIALLTRYNYDSILAQFTIGSDCRVYHRWQLHAGGQKFSRWISLGGCASSRQLAVGMNGDDELTAFVISPDHTVRYKSQSKPGLGPWTGWTRLGGNVYTGLSVLSAPNGSSPIRILARDKNGNPWEDEQTQGNCFCSGWHKVQKLLSGAN
jgi:hypothetical protein